MPFSCRIHAEFMHIQTCNIIFRFMSGSCQIHAEFMHFQWFWDLVLNWRFFPRFWCKFGWEEVGVEFMSNSCWIHADFIFTWNFHNALRNTLHNNGVEFMLNSCCIQAIPWKIPKLADKVAFEAFNWIIHAIYYYGIQSGISHKTAEIVKTIFVFTELLECSMNSAWIQHEFNTIVMQSVAQSIVKISSENEISMNSAWIRHDFNTNLISITLQSIVKKRVYKSFSMHYNLFVSYLNLN